MKTCSTCKETSTLDCFNKQSGRRDGLESQCKSCRKKAGALWKAKNPDYHASNYVKNKEQIDARNAAWYKANPGKANGYTAKWRKANLDKVKISHAAWNLANPGVKQAITSAWLAKNPGYSRAYTLLWREQNPEACRIQGQNRRAMERENGGKLSKGLAAKLFTLQRGMCACGCLQPLGDKYDLDHIMPIKLGGPNTDDNIQLLTQGCNNQKRAKHPIDFMQQRGFLL